MCKGPVRACKALHPEGPPGSTSLISLAPAPVVGEAGDRARLLTTLPLARRRGPQVATVRADVEWRTVATARNEPEAALIEQRLRAAGIPVVLRPGDARAYLGASSSFAITVPLDRLSEAQDALR